METDYSTLTKADFEKVVRSYVMFKLFGQENNQEQEEATDAND